MELLNAIGSFALSITALGILFFGLKAVFRPFEKLTHQLREHISGESKKDTNMSEIVDLLKKQITSIDDREVVAAQRMEEFVKHWKTSDQQYRQLFHQILAANTISKEQCRIHKLEIDMQAKTIDDHSRRIVVLEKDMKTVKTTPNEYNCKNS